MNILFITDFFPPETNAAASRVYERAKHWIEDGHSVTVITSVPNFPVGRVHEGYQNKLYQVESMSGVRVVRVKTFIYENTGRVRRSLDLLSFLFTALPVAMFESKPDVIVATTPNFFAGVAGCIAALLRRKVFVLEVGDLWPAFAIALNQIRQRPLIKVLEKIELYMYAKAERIICLSPAFERDLTSRGISDQKIAVVTNGADLNVFHPKEPPSALVERLNPDGKLIIGYFGTVGLAHGLDRFLAKDRELGEFKLIIAGDGAATGEVRKSLESKDVKDVTLLPSQPRDLMPDYWALCDVALVVLKDIPVLGAAIPSKMFEAMACGVPILLVAPEGEAAQIVRAERCGLHVLPDDVEQHTEALSKLADGRLRSEFRNAALQAASKYSRERQASQFMRELDMAMGA